MVEDDDPTQVLPQALYHEHDDDDDTQSLGSPPSILTTPVKSGTNEQNKIKTYKRRWYILVMFGIYAFTQNFVWNNWGPISASSESAFGWGDATIAWLTNWGPVAFILFGLVLPWLLQVKGLRWAILLSMFLVALGTAFRVITSDPTAATVLIHIGQFSNGIAGPIGMAAYPTLSAAWFPPHERVTATAIGTGISVCGAALAFVLGPVFVSTLPSNSTNTSSVWLHSNDNTSFGSQQNNTVPEEREQIMRYMYYQCGWAVFIFLVILIYYPAKPPTPPSVSATVQRDNYWSGLWSLRKKGGFLIVAMTYGISTGVLNVWITVLYINLKSYNVSESTAGWLGFYSSIGASFVSMIVGRFSDLFARFMKIFILALYILGTIFLILFALLLLDVIPYSIVYVYVTVIAAYVLVNAAIPVMYEMACELAYPTSEGAANGLMTYINNMWGLLFLAIFSIPDVGTMWMNWFAIAATVICIPLIAVIKVKLHRLEVDTAVKSSIQNEIIVN